MFNLFKNRWSKALIIAAVAMSSCEEEDKKEPAPLLEAEFTFAAAEDDASLIQFTNESIGSDSWSWDFGDGSAVSTSEDPQHVYAAGTYTVELTANAPDGRTTTISKSVTVADAQSELRKLTGDESKTWKLIRDASEGDFAIEIGPQNRSTIYWSFGGVTPLAERPCVLNDEFTFSLQGDFTYDSKGDIFADAGEFGPWSDEIGSICIDAEDANFLGKNGEDLSAWNDGEHAFDYNVGAQTLTVTGLGAFIGLQKIATDGEVLTPQESVTYNVVKLSDGEVDTLILEALHGNGNYWRFVLVHYDDPSMEPGIPGVDPPDDDCVADAAQNIEGSSPIVLTLETATSSFGGFDGVSGGRVANPHVTGINTSCFVNQYDRAVSGCQSWSGAAIGLPSAIDFAVATKKKFKLKVYAEAKTTDVVLRLERLAYPDVDPAAERTATITAVGEWQELTFDFSDITDPNTYKNLVIYFDRGSCSERVQYYFDDLTQID